MKTALLTGSTGFVGHNVIDILRQDYQLLTPRRAELDLRSLNSVQHYFDTHQIDVVFHCANPNPVKNAAEDSADRMTDDSLRIFLNLYACREQYEKMIYLGSGAEYNKQLEICNIREEDCFRSPPGDSYGLTKYTMNLLASQSENIYNLCLFACYGPGDHPSKFITHCIRCCLSGQPVTIRQDCKFDYIHVWDLGRMMSWMGTHPLQHHMYNVSGCEHAMLSDIAREVCKQMQVQSPVEILSPGLNREYTANGQRFWTESQLPLPMSLRAGIALQIQWEKEQMKHETACG